ncbi:hypothetical protein [uncultured Paludibaculum sp.]|uniref:hypothetical protein n=1 Tax=uncultured Paludibaculum sp. TaxID=1765020 RepID=UPI002AAB6B5D|nr:hypothetical protein [uncultured Paludibaculum sp.]
MRLVLPCLAVLVLSAVPARPAGHCETNPESPWCTAKTIYVDSRSGFMRETELERGILQIPEFARSGLKVTRMSQGADLVLEVRRKAFTSQFTLTVVDQRSHIVLASDRANSIGGHIEPKLAKEFVKMLKNYR